MALVVLDRHTTQDICCTGVLQNRLTGATIASVRDRIAAADPGADAAETEGDEFAEGDEFSDGGDTGEET